MSDERGHAPKIIHVGPNHGMVGGVASVLRALSTSELADRYELRFVSTVDGSGARMYVFARSVIVLLRELTAGAVVVHLHTASKGSFWRKFALSLLSRCRAVPYIVHVHGGGFSSFITSGSSIRRRAVGTFVSRAAAVLVLNEETRASIAAACSECRILDVVNPVAVRAFRPENRRQSQVVFVGRLTPQKGVFDLIDAIAQLQRGGCVWRWVFVGACGDPKAGLEIQGLPRPDLVDLVGEVSPPQVLRYLDESSIFCLPSYVEGLPVSLLEAMAAGLACVASRVGGIPDALQDDVTGLLIEPGEVGSLVEALDRLITDDAARCRIARAAWEYASERFGMTKLAGELSALYDELAPVSASGKGL